MSNRLLVAALLVTTALVPGLASAAPSPGMISDDDAQRASKVLTQSFGHYDSSRHCWPIAARELTPASCLDVVAAVGVDGTAGTELHVLLGGPGITEMVTMARNAGTAGWTISARSAPIVNGRGDAPAEAKDLHFEKLGPDRWGWAGRSALSQKYIVFATAGSEILLNGGGSPAPKTVMVAAPQSVGEKWQWDEVSQSYVPASAALVTRSASISTPRRMTASARRDGSVEVADTGLPPSSTISTVGAPTKTQPLAVARASVPAPKPEAAVTLASVSASTPATDVSRSAGDNAQPSAGVAAMPASHPVNHTRPALVASHVSHAYHGRRTYYASGSMHRRSDHGSTHLASNTGRHFEGPRVMQIHASLQGHRLLQRRASRVTQHSRVADTSNPPPSGGFDFKS